MKYALFADVAIKATGQTGTVVERDVIDGKPAYIVELDDSNADDFLPSCYEDELAPV